MPLFGQQNIFTDFRFFSLGSGSSGNCYFLGSKKYGILIDAGINIRSILKTLTEFGSSISQVRGILVTHDHADHIKTVAYIAKKYNIPIYATESVFAGINRSRYTQHTLDKINMRVIRKGEPFLIEDFLIEAFDVPHDSIDNNGYKIDFAGQCFVLATDIGRITNTIENYATMANHLVFEANYDLEMLKNGSYPYRLKQRITSGMGHLGNHEAADFLAKIYNRNHKNIWLCHLSKDNNTPEIALNTISQKLTERGVKVGTDLKIEVLNRGKASGLRYF